jgi:HD-GYP domain-containing protein (c-di-GMP phosphodiesterase class II)
MNAPRGELRLAEQVAALSLATDLGMGQPLEQALRYCLVALELGRRLDCDAAALSDIYYVALLEHLGCTANAPEGALLNGGDELALRSWAIVLTHASAVESLVEIVRRVGEGRPPARRAGLRVAAIVRASGGWEQIVELQCEAAARLAERLGTGDGVRAGLGHVYERWDGKGAPSGVAGEQLALAQRVVSVAHDAVTCARLQGARSALDVIRRRRGRVYDPRVCDALLSDWKPLLHERDAGDAWERVLDAEPAPVRTIEHAQLDGVAEAFADFADMKAPFLMGHSRAVAELAAAAGRGIGCGSDELAALRRAGLLHDLGRLGVANGVWEKRGALDSAQRERVSLHPYYSERILARASAFAGAAACAARHHERLDGSGYHRGVGASQLPLDARLLQAADAYDAMTHERPHRPALEPNRARAELRADVQAGRLDQRAVNAVLEAAGSRPVRVPEAWPGGLSDREVDVLRLLARGKTNRQVAAELVIAPKTVGRHVENIYAKTGLSTRAGAALFCAEHELLD